MNSWLKHLVVLLFLSSVVACTPAQVDTGVSAGENPTEVRDAQLLGEPYVELSYQETTANNCDGQNRITKLERSLSQGQTTFFEVQVGAGGLIRGALIPQVLEAELEAKIQAALGRVLSDTQEQGVHIELETQPGTVYQHTVTWKETKVKGVIDVIYPSGVGRVGFEKIIGLELGDRTSRALSCSGTAPTITPQALVEPTSPPISTTSSATPKVPTPPAPVTAIRFEVKADVQKNGTGLFVTAGDIIHIEYLEGQWTGDSSQPGLSGGCGATWNDPVAERVWLFPPEQRGAALVGYINNEPLFIGCRPIDIVAPISGELFLGMSDCLGCFGDNAGQLYVNISINRQ